MLGLTIALAVLVGVALGVLGGGGSILTVPLLAYVAGMEPKQAIATSLLIVGVTSAVGAVSHARAGRVQWRTGLIFGVAGMAGAYAGGLLGRFIPGPVLLVGFAVMMIATAIAMLRGRRATPPPAGHRIPVAKVIAEGLIVGIVTGLVGAGGGFLVVPALALLGGLPMPVAVGTSLVVIAMKSFAGLAGYLTSVQIDWTAAGLITAAAVLGALLGARLTALVNPDALRQAFGWFVLAMSSVILGQEIHLAVGVAWAGMTALAAALYLTCRIARFCPWRWLIRRRVRTAAAAA
ncbi:sulfite exporter TauE/SafE family protein [Mycolicibacterium phlei]|jgi:uncharacterized membrane protein YfcA